MNPNNKVMNQHTNLRLTGGKGILAACCMSFSTVGLSLIIPDNQIVNLIGVIIIPFIVALIFLKNFMHALTLTWLNEMFLGVGGVWMGLGPISGRGALLLLVLLIYAIARPSVIYNIHRQKRDLWIVFYGVIFPIMLLGYSVIIRGNAISDAISDVQRFLIITMYFPVRDLMTRHLSFVSGWLSCTIAILSLLLVSLVFSFEIFKIVLLHNWFFEFAGLDDSMTAMILDTGRAAFTPLIFCMIGVFLGIIYTIDSKANALTRLASVILLSISLGALVINFLRGPIISIFVVFMILTKLMSGFGWSRLVRSINLITILTTMVLLGYIVTISYFPTALTKWDVRDLEFREMVSPVRIEQTEQMLKAWFDEPFLGQGVGSLIYEYSRDESGLSFEVQYPMILYRTGFIGFVFIIAPLLWVLSRTYRRIKINRELFSTDEGKLFLSMGCSIGALMMTSWVNPYLASSMTFVFILLFLASDSTLPIDRQRRFSLQN